MRAIWLEGWEKFGWVVPTCIHVLYKSFAYTTIKNSTSRFLLSSAVSRVKTNLPVQIFLSPPVVLFSFISRFDLLKLQIDSYTTGSQKKIWSSIYRYYVVLLVQLFVWYSSRLNLSGWVGEIHFSLALVVNSLCLSWRHSVCRGMTMSY